MGCGASSKAKVAPSATTPEPTAAVVPEAAPTKVSNEATKKSKEGAKACEKAASERSAAEKTTAGKLGSDKAPAEKEAIEKAAGEKAAAQKPAASGSKLEGSSDPEYLRSQLERARAVYLQGKKDEACMILKAAFDDGTARLDGSDESTYLESTTLLQRIRDILTVLGSDDHGVGAPWPEDKADNSNVEGNNNVTKGNYSVAEKSAAEKSVAEKSAAEKPARSSFQSKGPPPDPEHFRSQLEHARAVYLQGKEDEAWMILKAASKLAKYHELDEESTMLLQRIRNILTVLTSDDHRKGAPWPEDKDNSNLEEQQ